MGDSVDDVYGGPWSVRRIRLTRWWQLRIWFERRVLGRNVAYFNEATTRQIQYDNGLLIDGRFGPQTASAVFGKGVPYDGAYSWSGWVWPEDEPPPETYRRPLDW